MPAIVIRIQHYCDQEKMYKRKLTSRQSAELWAHLLDEASGDGTLVLVNNLLMEREVRRKWQRDKKGFAPDIRTLESWLEELALHSLPEEDLPSLLLQDEERTMWLEQWLSAHPDAGFRRFSGAKSVTAISNIIGSLCRDDCRSGALLDYLNVKSKEAGFSHSGRRSVLAELLVACEKEMEGRNWLHREQLIGKMERVAGGMLRYSKVVLFLPDELDVLQEKALRRIAEGENAPDMIVIQFDESDDDEEDISRINVTGESAGAIYLAQHHHPREELESALKHILAQIMKMNGADMDVYPHRTGSRFDDYVILTGDLSIYESMISSVSQRYDIPLYTSRGMALISHPFIRRLLTYLKLEHNGFRIDDIFHVFADNRIVLPELEDFDEEKPPNFRHFSQFCRAYNFRTLDEVSAGMSILFEWLMDQIQFENDEEREQKRVEALRRDQSFYMAVVRHLEALRTRYKTPARQNLADWVAWAESLLDVQKDLMSREANEVRELLAVILQKISGAQAKLNLGQRITRYDFFKLLELRLKETRERPQERPGGVLLTEIRHLPVVHDKIVLILGLHEDGFPGSERNDFLRFRYEKALQAITGREETGLYDLGRMQLRRILASEHPRFLSRPALVEQKKVMPSPLWLELEDQMKRNNKLSENSGGQLIDGWPEDRHKWLMSDYDIGIAAVSGVVSLDEGQIPADLKSIVQPFMLAAKVGQERQNPGVMGRYDGVIDPEMMNRWWSRLSENEQIRMSISRLDTFALSPQEYFYKYILRLQPLHEYQEDAESTIKGSLLHHILQDFYSETPEEGPPVYPPDEPEAAKTRMNAIRDRLIDSYRYQLGNPESPFPGMLIKNLEQVTRWFVEKETEGYPDFTEGLEEAKPSVFLPGSGLTMEHKWEFERVFNGLPVRFQGMIDRIDLTPDGKCGVIYDYKSGRSGAKKYKDILEGRSFQLPVYGMFIKEKNIPFYLAGYYQLPVNGKRKDVDVSFALGSAELIQEQKLNRKKGGRHKNMVQYKPAEELDAFMDAIEDRRISWIIQAIREGIFHVSLTGDPKWSDFRFISRYDERIQQIRKSRELSGRKDKGMNLELDRYYLAVPFWEDNHE